MGNALAELKARGWAVTASNDEAGVARAIERYILADANVPTPSSPRKASY
jgi:hydroxymethylpyrimidine pyrophosphatase-like HAD family hydrolase